MGAYKLDIGDRNHYLRWDGSALTVKGLISVDNLSAINADLGNITAGNIRGTRFQVGAGTDQDIFFEDSGIRLYDAASNYLRFYKLGVGDLYIYLTTNGVYLKNSNNFLKVQVGGSNYTWDFKSTGCFELPTLDSAPAATQGEFAYNATNDRPTFRNVSAWRHWVGVASW